MTERSHRCHRVNSSHQHPGVLPPCSPVPQGPIPGRLEGDRSYFLLRVGELRCTVWAGEADFKLQGIWAKSCIGGGMRSSRLLWSRDTQPVPAA